jgi:hypothetical protein
MFQVSILLVYDMWTNTSCRNCYFSYTHAVFLTESFIVAVHLFPDGIALLFLLSLWILLLAFVKRPQLRPVFFQTNTYCLRRGGGGNAGEQNGCNMPRASRRRARRCTSHRRMSCRGMCAMRSN